MIMHSSHLYLLAQVSVVISLRLVNQSRSKGGKSGSLVASLLLHRLSFVLPEERDEEGK